MEIVRNYILQASLGPWADALGLVMEVNERVNPPTPSSRFYASFRGVEVMERSMLRSTFGNGATEDEAIRNYAAEISHKRLVFHAMGEDRHEFQAPLLVWCPNGR